MWWINLHGGIAHRKIGASVSILKGSVIVHQPYHSMKIEIHEICCGQFLFSHFVNDTFQLSNWQSFKNTAYHYRVFSGLIEMHMQ